MAHPLTPETQPAAVETAAPATSGPLQRYGALLGWCLYPMLALLVLMDLRNGIHGRPEPISAQLVGFTLLSLATAPFLWLRRDELSRTGRRLLGLFSVVLGYALVSSLVATPPYLQHVHVPRHYQALPMVTAIVTMTTAWGLVLAVPAGRRRNWLWWGAVTVLLCSLVEWPRMVLSQSDHSPRLATGMGGAATMHVVTLLCAAVLAGAALEGRRRRLSWAGAALGVVMTLATGSRAGLLCLVLAAGMLVVWAASRGFGRIAWIAVGAGVVVFGVLLAVVPKLRRLVSFSDELRTTNLHTGLRAFNASWHNRLLGAGEGRVWPWYAFETNRLKVGWRGQVTGEFGRMQTNPHSTFLGIMVELGLLCLLVYLAFCLVLLLRLVREWHLLDDPTAFVVSLVLVAGLVANVFDTYLLKNFGVSLWWWLVVAACLGVRRPRALSPAGRDR